MYSAAAMYTCARWPPCSASRRADCAPTCAPVWCHPSRGEPRRAALLVPGSGAAAQGGGPGRQPAHPAPPRPRRPPPRARAAGRRGAALAGAVRGRRAARWWRRTGSSGGSRPRARWCSTSRQRRAAAAKPGRAARAASAATAGPAAARLPPTPRADRRRALRARLRPGGGGRTKTAHGGVPAGHRARRRATPTPRSTWAACCTRPGKPFEALAHYRAALAARPDDATAAFNLGVALEDLGRGPRRSRPTSARSAIDPDTADAHYNVARLFEQTGESESAIRHLLIYRRLTRKRR